MADKPAQIADTTRAGCSRLALALAAAAVMAGCQAEPPAPSKSGALGGRSASPIDGVCQSRAHDRLTYVAMNDFDPKVAIAISAAAETTEQSSSEILDNYCLLDRNLDRPGKRCFLFLTRTIQPGGEIYVCVTPDGRPTDIDLGE